MKPLRLYAAVSCFFLFLSCVESEEQAKKVLNAMHELGKELLSVSF